MTEDLLLDLPPGALSSGIPVPLVISPAAARLIAGAKTGGLMRSLSSARLVTSNKTKGLSLSLPASVMAVGVIGADAAPTVLISTEAAETVYTTFGITITFSEDVTGFVEGDITVVNATLSAFTAVSGSVYTVDVTPDYVGDVSVSVAAGVCTDVAGNANSAGAAVTRALMTLIEHMNALIDASTGGGMTAYYPDSGAYGVVYNTALAEGRNILIDGDMEAVGVTAWTLGAAATLTKEAGTPHGGSQVLRIAYNGTNYPSASQVLTQIGATYRVTGFARGNGTYSPGVSKATPIWTGTSSTDWQPFDVVFTATGLSVFFFSTATGAGYAEFDDVTVVRTSILASSSYPGAELLTDGDMEAADASAWSAVNSATLSKQTATPHSGTRVLRIAYNSVSDPGASQAVLTVGKRYRPQVWARSDGTYIPIVRNAAGTALWTGTTSTAWQLADLEYIAAGTSIILSSNCSGAGYVEYDDASLTEVNPILLVHTGVTLQQAGPDGVLNAALYDGTNDYSNLYSATFNSFFTPTQGGVDIACQVSAAGVWTDDTKRVIFHWAAGANNYISIFKGTDNLLHWCYCAGGTLEEVTLAATPTGWFTVAITWDTTAGMMAFFNGSQTGETQAIAGTWVGNLTVVLIGALSTTPTSVWSGVLAPWINWRDDPTAATLLQLAQHTGVV